MNILKSFLLSFIAGSSTLFGIIPTYISKKYQYITINLSLSVSFTIILLISLFSLIPDALYYIGIINIISIIIYKYRIYYIYII